MDTEIRRVRSRRSITIKGSEPTPQLHVTEVVYESIEGPDTTNWYFDLSGRILVASLNYWRSDPHGEKYREVLQRMLSVIAAAPSPRADRP